MTEDIFLFDDFVLDRGAYELRRGEVVVPLQRIPLELLCLLIERRGQLVRREEILERVWGKGVFVDSETSINTAVRKLRRALGDNPEAPRFVVTVPGRGYRFVAEIRDPKPSGAEQSHARSPGSIVGREGDVATLQSGLDDAAAGRRRTFLDSSAPQSPAGSDLLAQAPVKYAKSGDVHIAYRIFGHGPRDMVLIPGTLSHVELYWERPAQAYLLKRLTSFARVIVFDKRGQGLSDRVAEQTLDERIGDVRAVMDAAGSECATVYGWSEGGPMTLLFSATYPERTSGLILYGTFACMREGLATASDRARLEQGLAELSAHWGEGSLAAANAPSQVNNEDFVRALARLERASASPASIVALFRANFEIDVRHILPSIHLPTLILHRIRDALVPVAAGRYLAEHIAGARFVELPGDDHTVTDLDTQDLIADEIEEFVTGALQRPEPDRVLATIVFTHIVDPIERAAQMGEQRWSELLRRYYEVLRIELATVRGREVKTVSDGLLATFDGPARAIKFACSARDKVRRLGLQVRIGLHTGECELIGHDIGGIALDIAARVASLANPDQVLLSSTVKDLVASPLQFADRGIHTLEGIPGEWHLFEAQ